MVQSWDVIVIGAGAAGMLAAATAARRGRRVLLLEKNRKVGVKILMSGGTRCNLTHATDARGIAMAFDRQQATFLRSALSALGPQQVVELFGQAGVATKVEPTGKIFPVSDRAVDVQQAMLRMVTSSGAVLSTEAGVERLQRLADGGFRVDAGQHSWQCQHLLVTTGGQSYPGCGTRGDGYAWMQQLGHTIVAPRPALVPVLVRADWAKSLQGITLPDVLVRIVETARDAQSNRASKSHRRASTAAPMARGSLLFAHFGLSGPAALDVSRFVTRHPAPRTLELVCDFLPDLPAEALDGRLREQSQSSGKKQLAVLLAEWLPRRLVEALLAQAQVDAQRRLAELSRHDRQQVVAQLKATHFGVSGTLGFEKAEVTTGGVCLDEIDSRDMQSKRARGLYIAGELLDVDGPIGGYNFQAAFSTGWLAGHHV